MTIVEERTRINERRRIVASSVRTNDYFPFMGGLNLVDPPLTIKPGQLLGVQNYEPFYRGGYRRVDGYERLDGRLKPSAAPYWAIEYTDGSPGLYPAPGDVVNGATSGATGITLAVTRRNLHFNSEDLSLWSAISAATVDPNTLTAVDGALTGDRLVENGGDAEHFARSNFNLDAGTYALSVHLQAGERTVVALRVRRDSDSVNLVDSYLDLTSEAAIMRTPATADVILTPRPHGWVRASASFTLAASDTVRVYVYLLLGVGSQATSYKYTGDGASGVGIWGIQLTPGALQDYVASSGGQSGTLIIARKSGTFHVSENLREIATIFARTNGPAAQNIAPDAEHYGYLVLAHDDARSLIQKPAGEGPVRGAVQYGALAYCFRDNAGATAGVFYKSSPTGWQAVSLSRKLRFTDGNNIEVFEGDVLVGNTSGATATVMRVGLRDGFWGSSPPAQGYFIFTAITGAYQDGEVVRVGSDDVAIADGADFEQTLEPGGTYEFRITNFYGHTKGIRLYGTSGVDYGFEYDDDDGVFVQIETGMVDDTPAYLASHQNQLWYSFSGGSLQKSSVGVPTEWRVVTGAAELGVGREITGLMEEVGGSLFVFTRDQVKYVSGTSNADYQLLNFSTETGGFARTLQRIGQGIILDDRGFTSLATTDRFGNYAANSFSILVNPLLNQIKLHAVASVISRRLNLYRCFFDEGQFLSIGVSGTKITGITSCILPAVVHAATSFEDHLGREVILLAGEDGYVYEMDPELPPLSFDGEEIEAALRTVFHHSRDPSRFKRYRRAQIDLAVTTPTELQMSIDYSFAGPIAENEQQKTIAVDGGGGFWDVSAWDTFKWDLGPIQSAVLKLEGSGTNFGLLVYGKSAAQGSHLLSGISLTLSPRRINRGSEA